MGSAGSSGDMPTVAYRIVLEHKAGEVPDVSEVLAALQSCAKVWYIEVHKAKGTVCDEVGHLYGDPCPRCVGNGLAEWPSEGGEPHAP